MNAALREHVTRVGFNLTLGKTHIAALVLISEYWAKDLRYHAHGSPWSQWITGNQGCRARGLTWHQPHDTRGIPVDQRPLPSAYFGVTTAGQYTIGLLAEAGIWQDYLDLIERHKKMGMFTLYEDAHV